MERIESPPRAKKLSCSPTRPAPRTRSQISASARSSRVAGGTYCTPQAGTVHLRRRQRRAVHLAVGGQRQGGEADEDGGHHVLRQAAPRGSARSSSAWRRGAARHDIGHQPQLVRADPPARPPPPPRSPPGGRRAGPPRSPPARCGSRAPSPGDRSGPGTRAARPAGNAPRSPVRYRRDPELAASGSGTNRSAVSSGRPR